MSNFTDLYGVVYMILFQLSQRLISTSLYFFALEMYSVLLMVTHDDPIKYQIQSARANKIKISIVTLSIVYSFVQAGLIGIETY